MKTAISLPDEVFEAADSLAVKLKMSRSQLYVTALEKFILENQDTDVTNRINKCIEEFGQPIDDIFLRGSINDMRKVGW